MTIKETDGFVSVVNTLIEQYCAKYPNEYEFDKVSIGYNTKTCEIFTVDGEYLSDTLDWVNDTIIPDLFNLK